jgi:hypothetical protein
MLLCLVKAFFHWEFGEFGFLLRGGQDRDEPLLSEGTLLSGHGGQQSAGEGPGAVGGSIEGQHRWRQPIRGPGRPGSRGRQPPARRWW